MPKKAIIERAREDARQEIAPSTQAGEFLRDEFRHIRQGKHDARSAKQAIAIGLSEARRAGINLPPPRRENVSEKTLRNAERGNRAGQAHPEKKASPKRARATLKTLKRESRAAASYQALSRQARQSACKRQSHKR